MQVTQLVDKTRNNTLRRFILKQLVLESNYAAKNSKFLNVVRHYGIKTIPLFTSTEGRLTTCTIRTADGIFNVKLNVRDKDYNSLLTRLRPLSIAKAQALFNVGVNHRIDGMEEMITACQGMLQGLGIVAQSLIQKCISMCCKIFVALRIGLSDPKALFALFVDLLCSFNVTSALAFSAWECIKNHTSALFALISHMPRAQAGVDLLTSLVTVVAVCFGSVILARLPKESEISSMMKSVTSLGQAVRGASMAFDGIGKVVGKVVSNIFHIKYGVPTEISELEVFMTGIQQWFIEVQQLIELGTYDRLDREPALCARVQELYRQGFQFNQQAAALKLDRHIMQPFNVHWQALRKYYEKAGSSSAFTSGPRHEPLVIYMSGESGQGKSGLMYCLATELLKIDGIPRDVKGTPDVTQEIYTRTVETEYWDGYKNQRICLFDDIFQMIDTPANPNLEIMEIIRTGNLTKLPLHMAELSDKGATCFNSKVVICTSNTPIHSYCPQSITDVVALKRRVDLNVTVRALSKYCSTKGGRIGINQQFLDPAKVYNEFGTHMHQNVYAIRLEDPLSGDVIKVDGQTWISYRQFIALATEKYTEKFRRTAEMHEFLAKLAVSPPIGDALQTREAQPSTAPQLPVTQIGIPQLPTFISNFWKQPQVDPVEFSQTNFDRNTIRLKSRAELLSLSSQQIASIASEIENLRCVFPTRFANDVYAHRGFLVQENNVPLWRTILSDHTSIIWHAFSSFELVSAARRSVVTAVNVAPLVAVIVPTKTSALLTSLKMSAQTFATTALQWLDKVRAIVKEHPLLCAAAAIVPLLLYGVSRWYGSGRIDKVDMMHSQLEISAQRVKHSHECLKCSKLFEHTHVIQDVAASMKDLPICGTCAPTIEALFDEAQQTIVFSRRDVLSTESVDAKPISSFFSEEQMDCLKESRLGEYVSEELSASGDPRTKKRVMRVQLTTSGDPKTLRRKKITVEAEFRSDQGAHEVSEKVRNNVYQIAVGDGENFLLSLKIVILTGRIGLTVAHLVPYLEKNSHVKLTSSSMPDGFIFKISDLIYHQVLGRDAASKDQLLIEFPKRFPNHPQILKNVASSEDMAISKLPVVLVNPSCKNVVYLKYGMATAHDKPLRYTNEYDQVLSVRSYYSYEFETVPGDCGSVMVGIGHAIQHKIMAIHIAGSVGRGFGSPLNRSDLEEALKKFSPTAQICLDLEPILDKASSHIIMPEGNFVCVGNPIYSVPRPLKTKLRKSAIFEQIARSTTAPSVLTSVWKDGKRIDPLMNGLKKSGSVPPSLNLSLLDACVNDVSRLLSERSDPDHRRVLTNQEAVAGIELDDFAPGITRTTSPGFPLVREIKGVGKGKQKWLGTDEYLLPPDIEAEMNLIEINAAKAIRTPTIWTDTLKDERRPLHKINDVKTRVFSAGPMCYTLVFRKYFLGFASHCAKNRVHNEIAVGTNVYSMDWHCIAERMQSKGKKVIAGDFSNFDGTLVSEILWAILDIINQFYGDGGEAALIREVLWCEIVNSVHVFDNSVYIWTHSQPSGCPLTAIINSIYNSLSMRYVWMLVVPQELKNMQAFNRNVAMIAYGDDNIVNISDRVIDIFNQVTIAAGYAEFGMTYTDETKSGELTPFRTLGDISFLKRTFLRDASGLHRAPLSLETVLEMTNWIRGDMDEEAKTRENMETAAFELSLHPDEVFDHWIQIFRAAGRTLEEQPQLMTLSEYRTSALLKMQGLCAAS